MGLVAIGACGLRAAPTDLAGQPSKPWSISASLRGFYDDNINDLGKDASPGTNYSRSSIGFEVNPAATLNLVMEQTIINLSAVYSLKYYENKPMGNADNYDQTFTFNGSLDHAFSERYRVSVSDSFVIGQEPDMLRQDTLNTFHRISGDNIRNYGAINFDAVITPLLSLQLGYANTFYDYAYKGSVEFSEWAFFNGHIVYTPVAVYNPNSGIFEASSAGTMNGIQHTIHLDSRWTIQPETIGIIGVQYTEVDFTGNEPIGAVLNPSGNPYIPGGPLPTAFIYSDSRNNRGYYGYVGVDHTFNPRLSGSIRVGARYTDFYNDVSTSQNGFSPYAMLSAQYMYAPESSVQAGLTYDRSSTDLVGASSSSTSIDYTTDADTVSAYISWNHRITPRLYASLLAQFQDSMYNGGTYGSLSEQYYLLGLNFEYRFNHYLSANAGYNYDLLDSPPLLNRGFERNKVYMGITARY